MFILIWNFNIFGFKWRCFHICLHFSVILFMPTYSVRGCSFFFFFAIRWLTLFLLFIFVVHFVMLIFMKYLKAPNETPKCHMFHRLVKQIYASHLSTIYYNYLHVNAICCECKCFHSLFFLVIFFSDTHTSARSVRVDNLSNFSDFITFITVNNLVMLRFRHSHISVWLSAAPKKESSKIKREE